VPILLVVLEIIALSKELKLVRLLKNLIGLISSAKCHLLNLIGLSS